MPENQLTTKDFVSDREVKWCPGCGDYSILKQVQNILPETGVPKENIVFISGIGCSSRFPYYMNTYGMHSIHGRAPAVATGLKLANPELSVYIITGDGDALSIGGNHLIHILRRNVDVNILLFNNEIYGLTKGQYSPTSQKGLVTKTSPLGVIDSPFNPQALALGSGGTFIARTLDRNPKHLREILLESEKHKGSSFVEIYQNCIIFNDNVFEDFTDKKLQSDNVVWLEHGQALRFGKNHDKALILEGSTPRVVLTEEVSENDLWIHDREDKFKAFILTQIFNDVQFVDLPRPFGVIYQEQKPTYDDLFSKQHQSPKDLSNDLQKILKGNNSWQVV